MLCREFTEYTVIYGKSTPTHLKCAEAHALCT